MIASAAGAGPPPSAGFFSNARVHDTAGSPPQLSHAMYPREGFASFPNPPASVSFLWRKRYFPMRLKVVSDTEGTITNSMARARPMKSHAP